MPIMTLACTACVGKDSRIAELEALLKAQPRTINTEKLNPCCPTCGADPERLTDRIAELEETNRAYKEAWSVNILTDRIVELEATIRRAESIGHVVHSSWSASDDYKLGWKDCLEQIEEALGETK